MATIAHQCPRCELRFITSDELEHHITDDHHAEGKLGDPRHPHSHLRPRDEDRPA